MNSFTTTTFLVIDFSFRLILFPVLDFNSKQLFSKLFSKDCKFNDCMFVIETQKVMATRVALRRQQLSSNSSNNMSLSIIETTFLEQKPNYQCIWEIGKNQLANNSFMRYKTQLIFQAIHLLRKLLEKKFSEQNCNLIKTISN